MQDKVVKKIVERARKLLNLANSSNEHEARLAADQAQRLMTKYNLDMQQVDFVDEPIESANAAETDYLFHPRQYFVLDVVQKHFRVKAVKNYAKWDGKTFDGLGRRRLKKSITFYGRQSNVAVALDVFHFLDATFRRLWAEYMRETGTPANRQKSFYVGLVQGLDSQLAKAQKEVEQEAGLVVVDDAALKAMMEAMKLSKGKPLADSLRDEAAMRRGQEEGSKLRISRSLNQPTNNAGPTLRLGGRK